MYQNTAFEFAAPQGHRQRVDEQIGTGVVLLAPANDLSGEQIQYHCKLLPEFVYPDKRKVGDPGLIGFINLELAIPHVIGDLTDITTGKAPLAHIDTLRTNAGYGWLGMLARTGVAPRMDKTTINARARTGAMALIAARGGRQPPPAPLDSSSCRYGCLSLQCHARGQTFGDDGRSATRPRHLSGCISR